MTSAQNHLAHLQRFGIRPGLERIRELLQRLENPQHNFPIVLVGGTNGKGSTCELLARGLARNCRARNSRVGLYTSPHLYRWNERIRVLDSPNGDAFSGSIGDEDFDRLFETLQPHLDEIASDERFGQTTEFETMTALGFLHFAQQKVDIAVIEVGLGGKWDATNVCEPLVSVVTHVALDHCDRLGNTHIEIARDKVCIARPNRIFVTAETRADVLEVFQKHCAEIGARLWSFRNIEYSNDKTELQKTLDFLASSNTKNANIAIVETASEIASVHFANATSEVGAKKSANDESANDESASDESANDESANDENNIPDFQKLNAQTAFIAQKALAQNDAKWTPVSNAKLSTTVPGRFEIVAENPTTILDGANNPDGAQQLAAQLRKMLRSRPQSELILVLGILQDKDFRAMIAELAPLAHRIIATQSNSPRACDAQIVATEARRFCERVEVVVPVEAALERARQSSTRCDMVCVTGSFYTIGEITTEHF